MITILFILTSVFIIKNFDFVNNCVGVGVGSNTCGLCSSISDSISSDETFKIKIGIYQNKSMLILQLNISNVPASRVVYKTKFKFNDYVFEIVPIHLYLNFDLDLDNSSHVKPTKPTKPNLIQLQRVIIMDYPYNKTTPVYYY